MSEVLKRTPNDDPSRDEMERTRKATEEVKFFECLMFLGKERDLACERVCACVRERVCVCARESVCEKSACVRESLCMCKEIHTVVPLLRDHLQIQRNLVSEKRWSSKGRFIVCTISAFVQGNSGL